MATLADRNLLFGIVALQMDFITRAQLMTAMNAAVSAKAQPLGEILLQQGALTVERRVLLDTLVQEQMKQHGGDPQQSLAAVSAGGSVRAELARIADADLQASLAHVPAASTADDDDPDATRAGPAAAPAATGVRYRILRPHAEGGLGKVWVALDEELRREVALKEIKERYADNPDSRTRFILEAEITAGLEHPGIVPVYGLGAYADGRPFYAMRFIRGDSLKEAIDRFHQADGRASSRKADVSAGQAAHVALTPRRSPRFTSLEFRELLRRFIDVCNAIAYAHSRGVLHRDLKPGNIILGKYGETLVVDWGLAKAGLGLKEPEEQRKDTAASTIDHEQPLTPASGSGSAETVAGSAIGTPQFMSPEQAAGRLDLLGPASDVYSLGATLYCLLTGKAPIEESDVGTVLRKVQKGDFPPPRRVTGKVPKALDAICQRALSLQPKDRYPSPRDLADDVERWLADERVLAYPEPLTARLGRWARRHRTLVSAATGLLLASAILLGVSTATFREMHKEADELREKADNALRAGQRSAYINAIRLAHEHWEDSDLKDIPELLANAGPAELRSWEWGYLNRLVHGAARTIDNGTPVLGLAISADGARLASAGADGAVRVWEAATGRKLFSFKAHDYFAHKVAFSPDGKHLATGGVVQIKNEMWAEIKLWPATGVGPARLLAKVAAVGVRQLSFSPDSSQLASVVQENLQVWNVTDGNEMFALPAGPREARDFSVNGVAFSADGAKLFTGGSAWLRIDEKVRTWGEIRCWDARVGTLLETLVRQHPSAIAAVAIDSETRELAAGTSVVTRWDISLGKPSTTQRWAHASKIVALEYSRDGRWLASAGVDGSVLLTDLRTGDITHAVHGHPSIITGLAFDPESRYLVTSGGEIMKFWDLAAPPDFIAALDMTGYAETIAFAPDSKTLVWADSDGSVGMVDPASGKSIKRIKLPLESGFAVALNAKGDRVLSRGLGGEARVFEIPSGRQVFASNEQKLPVLQALFSPIEGGPLATVHADGTIRRWHHDGREFPNVIKHEDVGAALPGRTALAFSPDGKKLAGAGHGRVKIWATDTGEELADLKSDDAGVLVFSPDGALLAAHGSELATLWDVASGRVVLSFHARHRADNNAVLTFTRDGRRLVTGNGDKISFWDIATGKEVLALNLVSIFGAKTNPLHLAFSPNGLILAVATPGNVLLWKAAPWE